MSDAALGGRAISSPAIGWSAGRVARSVVFAGLAALVLFGPGLKQVLEIRSPLLRPWTMFSGIGVGVLKGEFEVTDASGATTRLRPLEVLQLDRYPVHRSIHFDRLVREPAHLRAFGERLCTDPAVRVAFHGHTGSRQGWQALDVDDICVLDLTNAEAETNADD